MHLLVLLALAFGTIRYCCVVCTSACLHIVRGKCKSCTSLSASLVSYLWSGWFVGVVWFFMSPNLGSTILDNRSIKATFCVSCFAGELISGPTLVSSHLFVGSRNANMTGSYMEPRTWLPCYAGSLAYARNAGLRKTQIHPDEIHRGMSVHRTVLLVQEDPASPTCFHSLRNDASRTLAFCTP